MFSANENLMLRQHKKKVVDYVESCIPEEALDMGTMVMAMQVSCKAPGCVPLETAIVIVFPKLGDEEELIPGLPESCGGNYKTKVLKPMAEVTKDDILDALPPEFIGGRRSMEKLCMQTRDTMLGQITQLFAEEDTKGRQLMAEYLQQCLQEYMDRDCTPPEWGEPFPQLAKDAVKETAQEDSEEAKVLPTAETKASSSDVGETAKTALAAGVTKTGNFVFKRPVDDEPIQCQGMTGSSSPTRHRPAQLLSTSSSNTAPFKSNYDLAKSQPPSNDGRASSQSIMQQLGGRQHAAGVRSPGCPCCDPDNNIEYMLDTMMGK